MNNPSLRFTSLSQADWYETCLSDVVDVVGGGTPSTSQDDYWNGDVQWFTPSEITQKYVTESSRTITEEGVSNSSARYLPQGTILFTSRASLGLSSINVSPKKVTTNQGFQSLIPKEGWLSEFVYYLVNNRKFIQEVENRASGSTFKEISSKNLKSITLLVPSDKTEQQKIAAFFTALDEKISNADKIIDKKRNLIRSLIKKVLSREIRFEKKSGETFDEWKTLSLGDCCDFYAGQTPKSTSQEFYDGGIPWVASGDLNRGVVINTEKTLTETGVNSTNLKLLKKGTFIIALFGLEAESVCGNCGLLGIDSTINQACMSITPKNNTLLSKYIFYYYKANGKKFCQRYAQGTKQQNLNIDILSKFQILVPPIEEQKKICDFFDLLEDDMLLQMKKANTLRAMKKSLMQQMFV